MKQKRKKIVSSHANISDTPFDQKSPGHPEVGVLNLHRHTYIRTLQLYDWISLGFREKSAWKCRTFPVIFFCLLLDNFGLTKSCFRTVSDFLDPWSPVHWVTRRFGLQSSVFEIVFDYQIFLNFLRWKENVYFLWLFWDFKDCFELMIFKQFGFLRERIFT